MLERRSKAYKEIKARSTSYLQEDIEISDRDQDKKRKSNFNLLKRSPSKVAVDNAAKTAKTLFRQKSEEVKKTGTQGSDLYRWDDEDRESCEVLALKLTALSTQMKKAAFRASKISDLAAKKNESDGIRQKAMLKDVMAFEGMGSVVYYVY
jgi:hypothetical protein